MKTFFQKFYKKVLRKQPIEIQEHAVNCAKAYDNRIKSDIKIEDGKRYRNFRINNERNL